MSTIESIGVAGQVATSLLPNNALRATPEQADNSTSQPAVVVSLSSAATAAAAGPNLGEISANKVDDVLSSAAGANGFTNIYATDNWSLLEAKFGNKIADRDKEGARQASALFAGSALSSASNLGIPAQASVSPDDIINGSEPGHITVGNFNFTDGKSSYQITNGSGYTLVGTKDGQPWQTWHLRDPEDVARSDAEAALNALTSLTTHGQSAISGQLRSRLDVSV